MCNKNDDCNCFDTIINTILTLQNSINCNNDTNYSCDRPYLGVCGVEAPYNTRPVTLYTCRNNILWQMPYNDEGALSSVFRIESRNDCCCTLRVLEPVVNGTETTYTSTNNFFTIDLNCIGMIKCMPDTYIACI